VDHGGLAEHVDRHLLEGERRDRVALHRRAHPLLAGHRLRVKVDRGEAEAVGDELLEPVAIARLHRGHPLLLERRELLPVVLG
jgi:hypothetical protein